MDLTRPVTFRDFELNTVGFSTATGAAGSAKYGCTVDSVDYSELQVRQFTNPLSRGDGLDVGGVWIGGRIVRMTGTIYGLSRQQAYDFYDELAAKMLPESGTLGLYQLGFYVVGEFTFQQKTLVVRPEGLHVRWDRHTLGGTQDSLPLAIPWSASFFDPSPAQIGMAGGGG